MRGVALSKALGDLSDRDGPHCFPSPFPGERAVAILG
jgi:hypothetical protein